MSATMEDVLSESMRDADDDKEKLALYQSRIRASKQYRSTYEKEWKQCWDFYQHDFGACPTGQFDDQITVNLTHAIINQMMATTTFDYPTFTAEPMWPDHRRQAMLAEEVLRNMWVKNHWQEEYRLAQKDSYVMGHGWIKVSWLNVKDDERKLTLQEREQLRQYGVALREMLRSFLPDNNDGEQLDEYLAKVKIQETITNMPIIERISPLNMYVDPSATTERNMCWLAQKMVVKARDLQRMLRDNDDWNDTAEVRATLGTRSTVFQDNLTFNAFGNSEETGKADGPDVEFELYEMWDLLDGTYCVYSAGAGDSESAFLMEPRPIPEPERRRSCGNRRAAHPFDFLPNQEVTDRFYPMSEVMCIKEQQLALNRIATMQISFLFNHSNNYLVKESMVEHIQGMLKKRKDRDVCPIPDEDWDEMIQAGGEILKPIEYNSVTQDIYPAAGQVRADIYEITGMTDYQLGGRPEGRTATEAAILNANAQARVQEKIARVERSMASVARFVLLMLQEYWDQGDWIKLSGRAKGKIGRDNLFDSDVLKEDADGDMFAPVNRYAIGGAFDVIVDAGSTTPQTPETRMQDALQFVSTAVQFVAGGLQLDLGEMFYEVAESFGYRNPDRFLLDAAAQGGALGQNPLGTPPGGPPQPGSGAQYGQDLAPADPTATSAQLNAQVGSALPLPQAG